MKANIDRSSPKSHFLGPGMIQSPGGEIGRRTGLKILGFQQWAVPVRVRPGAPEVRASVRTVCFRGAP